MTAVAVVRHGLLRFPVTVETRRMIRRDRLECGRALAMADSAIVVTLLHMRESQQGNRILMPVMRKLDRELPFYSRISEREPCCITRRRLRMTHGTDRRSRAAEELRSMTAHTRIVTGVILDIREGYFVTCVARRLVFLRRMRKF